jgi:hypothetical protein
MAGSYADPPGMRIPYDRDGSVVYSWASGGAVVVASNAQARTMNDEDTGNGFTPGSGGGVGIIFPQVMTINGWWCVRGSGGLGTNTLSYSANTTNGFDGTWTAMSPVITNSASSSVALYRTLVQTISSPPTTAKAVRTSDSVGGHSFTMFHVYGKPTSATGDRLEVWHPTTDQALNVTPAAQDMGDVAQSATATQSFRIKNLSSTFTANSITVGTEAITDTGRLSELSVNINGGAFASTASISSLAPGAISQELIVRFVAGASSTLGLASERVYADASSWS